MPHVVAISDPLDPRLDAYTRIRERDLVAGDHFIAEGEVVLRGLLAAPRFLAESVLVAENRLERLMPLVVGLAEEVPIYCVSQRVLNEIAGFNIHRGILALGRRAEAIPAEILLANAGPDAVVLLLLGIANHDNIGGIFRNAAGFGAAAVLLDGQSCDPLYRKAMRVSVGASLLVPFARLEAGTDPLVLLRRFGFQALALSPRGLISLSDFKAQGRVAVILGTEGPGLPASILDRVPSVAIPMAPGFDSLNVATASGIVLHHLVSGRRAGTQPDGL